MFISYFMLGGHTAEMLSYTSVLTCKFQPRLYVIATTDSMSEQKVLDLGDKCDIKFSIKRIPRAREVKQSYASSIFSTLVSCLSAFPIVTIFRAKLIVINSFMYSILNTICISRRFCVMVLGHVSPYASWLFYSTY
ncbi:unnamed protein product [Schistosoma guineensis]|nr:unnamed protein product [Schistosoma guineensis]